MNNYLLTDKTKEIPMVSVAMLTYGHENYIKKAIDSVLMQQTSFLVHLVIADDFSPDNTRQIIQEYQRKFPDKIKLILQNKNIGAQENNKDLFANLTGKYIAALEGDDYWTDPLKLQKQVTFLEENEDYSIHSALAKTSHGDIIGNKIKNTFTIDDFFTNNHLITCTVLFRNTKINSEWFKDVFFGDWMLYLNILFFHKNTKAYCDNHVYAFYRIHENGAMQTINSKLKTHQAHLNHILKIKKIFKPKYSHQDIETIKRHSISLFEHSIIHKNYSDSFKIVTQNLGLTPKFSNLKKFLSILWYRKHLKK
ncbi:glycosyltransferase family 2 protein [Moheibacter sediminis]|uniref:Glycosyltransferase involved in cell wall bisynthesis n=1 Tax=Moheibacter sediminis TaxID=1434700 RepID=A0A1W1YX15_9FLAO|nr:glycosyltransferase [Moheibacter sediminis]SMC40750.1 Glycosyltransferase involved in cell wall bisynthesis [Moheibacter sediminis]